MQERVAKDGTSYHMRSPVWGASCGLAQDEELRERTGYHCPWWIGGDEDMGIKTTALLYEEGRKRIWYQADTRESRMAIYTIPQHRYWKT